MTRPRLKASKNNGSPLPEPEPRPIPLPALTISGVVVKKKELVSALRIYLPLIVDVQPFEDGENFYLILDGQREKEALDEGKG